MTLSPTSFIACLEYGYELTPWACIQNQLGLVLPIHPCWNCERPVTIKLPATSIVKPSHTIGENRQVMPQKAEKSSTNKPRSTWPPGMSKAVARALGYPV